MCMCGLGKEALEGCGKALGGCGDAWGICKDCGGGRPEGILPIATTEVRLKRSRESYVPHVLRPGPSPIAITAAAATAAAAIVAAAAEVAAAEVAVTAAAVAAAAVVADPNSGRYYR